MNKKNIITILIVLAAIVVLYFGLTPPKHPHGDLDTWREKEHGPRVLSQKNPDYYCMRCHKDKYGHTIDNYCNDCHAKRKVPTVQDALKK